MATPDIWTTFLKSAAMLSLVLGLIFCILYLMRRIYYGKGRAGRSGMIRMLAAFPLAPKERLVLIDVQGERLLLGVTPHTISCLAVLSGTEPVSISTPEAPAGFFSNLLNRAVEGER